MIPSEFSFESSPALALLAARCFILRRVGVWLVIFGAAGVVCLMAILNGFDRWYTNVETKVFESGGNVT
jgi:hypothetical protein